MARRVPREQEKKLVQILSEAIQNQVAPTREVMENVEGLREVQLSLADRMDVLEAWVDVSIAALKKQKASKTDIKKLQRLEDLARDATVALVYSAQVLAKQRLEILHLQRQLEQLKK